MSDVEKYGGSLDHLSEVGLRQLARNLQVQLFDFRKLESQLTAADELAKVTHLSHGTSLEEQRTCHVCEALAKYEKARGERKS